MKDVHVKILHDGAGFRTGLWNTSGTRLAGSYWLKADRDPPGWNGANQITC